MLFKEDFKQQIKFVTIQTLKQFPLLEAIMLENMFIKLEQKMEKEFKVIWELKIML